MLTIDWTPALTPMIYGLQALLVVSALAVAAEPVARLARQWMQTLSRPRVSVGRPALGHR